MKKLIAILIVSLFAAGAVFAADTPPKNAKVIAQSGTSSLLYVTVIDLSNNEMVILMYGAVGFSKFGLFQVIRTGVTVDPKTQNPVIGGDQAEEPPKPKQ